MIIQMTLPLQGTWYTREQRGDVVDSIRPLSLPFDLSYRCTLVSLDIDNGCGVYEIEISDASLLPGQEAAVMAFVHLTIAEKRAAFTERDGGLGMLNIREGTDGK